jgi:Concanavalin A-like lectin/glucanases superfamily
MKTSLLLGIVTGIFCLTIYSVFADETLTGVVQTSGLANSLDGYWTFDETSGGVVHDSSGNGFNGTVVNYPGGQGNWTSGLFGESLLFGGPTTHEYVSVPNFAMPTASMTLTAWVWANSTPNWATIAANWNGAWGSFNYATFGSTPNMSLYVADANVQGGINVDYGVSSTSLSLNQWHFLAFTANSQTHTVTFMQDGVVTGSFGYQGQLLASSSQLNIGDDPSDLSPGQGNWNGKIDDLAIWTRALSSQELATIYNAGLAGQPLLTLIPEPSVMTILSLGILLVAQKYLARR